MTLAPSKMSTVRPGGVINVKSMAASSCIEDFSLKVSASRNCGTKIAKYSTPLMTGTSLEYNYSLKIMHQECCPIFESCIQAPRCQCHSAVLTAWHKTPRIQELVPGMGVQRGTICHSRLSDLELCTLGSPIEQRSGRKFVRPEGDEHSIDWGADHCTARQVRVRFWSR